MEGVLREEGLAELGVAQLAVAVLIKPRHKERHLVVRHSQAQILQSVDQVLNAC